MGYLGVIANLTRTVDTVIRWILGNNFRANRSSAYSLVTPLSKSAAKFMAAASIYVLRARGHGMIFGPPATSAALLIPGSVPKQRASGNGHLLLLIVLPTLSFTAAYNAFAFERAAPTSDHGALPFSAPPTIVKHDPIPGHVQLVCPGGV